MTRSRKYLIAVTLRNPIVDFESRLEDVVLWVYDRRDGMAIERDGLVQSFRVYKKPSPLRAMEEKDEQDVDSDDKG